jgi:hypothetical protein
MSSKPLCPKCGEPVVKNGANRGGSGKQQWRCPNGHKPTDVVNAPSPTEAVSPIVARELARDMKRRSKDVKRYVITAAQNATPVFEPFLAALHSYCEHRNAELIVVPYRYHNPTSHWSKAAQSSDWWAEELIPFLMNRRVPLGDHLLVLGDISIQPTASRPTEGLETMTGARSAVIAHPKLELVSVPTPQQALPKLLTTTGACTIPNYIQAKAGKKGEFHHTYGAAVVEITPSGGFHLRQINALKDGSFQELDYLYSSDVSPRKAEVEALIMGDTHVKFLDRAVVEATWGTGGIVPTLKPKVLVWHDVHDGYAKHHAGHGNIERELRETFEFISSHAGPFNVFPYSNHPGWLSQWLAKTDPRLDLENITFWAETWKMVASTAKMGPGGAQARDAFTMWAERMIPRSTWERCAFLNADDSFTIAGIEVGMHGHLGPNGSKGHLEAFGKIGAKSVIGHSHSPGIKDGVYQVGTNSRLRLEFNHGPSSWLQTDALIYSTGKRTLINIIDGNWRA